jgi:hypothetical protein
VSDFRSHTPSSSQTRVLQELALRWTGWARPTPSSRASVFTLSTMQHVSLQRHTSKFFPRTKKTATKISSQVGLPREYLQLRASLFLRLHPLPCLPCHPNSFDGRHKFPNHPHSNPVNWATGRHHRHRAPSDGSTIRAISAAAIDLSCGRHPIVRVPLIALSTETIPSTFNLDTNIACYSRQCLYCELYRDSGQRVTQSHELAIAIVQQPIHRGHSVTPTLCRVGRLYEVNVRR